MWPLKIIRLLKVVNAGDMPQIQFKLRGRYYSIFGIWRFCSTSDSVKLLLAIGAHYKIGILRYKSLLSFLHVLSLLHAYLLIINCLLTFVIVIKP